MEHFIKVEISNWELSLLPPQGFSENDKMTNFN